MLKKWLYLIAFCGFLPLQSFATITGTVLIPLGTEFTAYDTHIELPNTSPYQVQYGKEPVFPYGSDPNYDIIHFYTPRPSGPNIVFPGNSRHTVAMDVIFIGNALDLGHLILGTRHTGGVDSAPDYNRGGAIIAGDFSQCAVDQNNITRCGGNRIAVEEIQIVSQTQSVIHKAYSSILQPGVWYRISVETIYQSGNVYLEARAWNIYGGNALVYSLSTTLSYYSGNYPQYSETASIGSIYPKPPGYSTPPPPPPPLGTPFPYSSPRFRFSNMKSYWSNANEWVPNP